ncbi:MAG: DNA-binding response regulator [Actinomycetales bacterium]|nr:MAG: DNA-binding response regulator [Actinomycetales bacterium]
MGLELTNVVIIDDDQLVRRAIVDYLRIATDIRVLATFPKAEGGIEFTRRNPVHVALVDIHMPGLNGIQTTKEIKATNPDTQVLILTSFDEDVALHGALDAGASGFLLKSTSPEALVDAVRAVRRGISVISGSPMSRLRNTPQAKPPEGEVPSLTQREQDVLALLCRGFSNNEIARDLSLSESSVKSHVTSIMQRLGVNSRLRAVVRAHELGFDRS